MTTIIVDAKSKGVYSDSRMTTTKVGSKEVTYTTNAEKIFKHKSGKMLAAMCGNANVSLAKLESLGFKVKTSKREIHRRDWVYSSEDTANIFIISVDSEKIVHLKTHINEDTLKVKGIFNIITDCNRIWAGSGASTGLPRWLFRYNPKIKYDKVIKACSLQGPFTDDKVKFMKLV